jgi:hypothetical protein
MFACLRANNWPHACLAISRLVDRTVCVPGALTTGARYTPKSRQSLNDVSKGVFPKSVNIYLFVSGVDDGNDTRRIKHSIYFNELCEVQGGPGFTTAFQSFCHQVARACRWIHVTACECGSDRRRGIHGVRGPALASPAACGICRPVPANEAQNRRANG